MVPAHLLVGVLAAIIAGLWGWMAGQPIWAVLGLYVLGGVLGVAASIAVMLRTRRSTAARTTEVALRTRSSEECSGQDEEVVRVAVVEHQRKALRQDLSEG